MTWKIIRKDKNGTTSFGSNIIDRKYAEEIAKKFEGYAGAGVEFAIEEEEKKNGKA